MIPPVTQMMLAFMKDQLDINAWEIEVPRFDSSAQPINPQATQTPSAWPVVTCDIEGSMNRNWNCGTDPYDDEGTVKIQVWGTTKASVQTAYSAIEELWAAERNWWNVDFSPAGVASNPFFVVAMMLKTWWLGQEKDVRLSGSLLCFRGELNYAARIHGAVVTQS